MQLSRIFRALALTCLAAQTAALALGPNSRSHIKPYKRDLLQDVVTFDDQSLFVNGERILILSGEFHPFRIPVPGLWLDVFQKVKSLGFNTVSFYVDWALLEGKQGDFSAEGVFDFKPFFDAASEAGIYLIARPGPYINAEVAGGGYPGWLQRITGKLRTPAPDYLNATAGYLNKIGPIIADAQITNGGPVILVQPENEYTQAADGIKFPDGAYMQAVEDQFRDAGITLPFVSNDASPSGHNAPGTGEGQVDIYGHDGYPLGFDCANPYTWPEGSIPTNWRQLHEEESPNTPYGIQEFQAGSFDPWGGLGFDQCATLLNQEFERVFYKNDVSFGVRMLNLYMIYGGTNWGNLGHQGGYTSYDYGSVLSEDRTIAREKYSELKLEANFLRKSPAYLTAAPQNLSTGVYTDTSDLIVTPVTGNKTGFYVVRHADYSSHDSTSYKLQLPTSAGNLTIPQLDGTLSLNGRDSKIHVTDYDVGGTNVLYSTAEIFTWQTYGDKSILVVYGGPKETHELAVSGSSKPKTVEGDGVTTATKNGATVLNWQTTTTRRVVEVGDKLTVYILDRNSAYNYWVLDLPGTTGSNGTGNFSMDSSVVVKAGYLLRTAQIQDSTLHLTGDLNATATFEVIGAPSDVKSLSFNGKDVSCKPGTNGALAGEVQYTAPKFDLPDLESLDWKYADSLPEIQSTYDDSKWTAADHKTTTNPRNLTSPTSLYGSDYGYNTGNLVYRGQFVANGKESTFFLRAIGGAAFGVSAWVNSTLLGSVPGIDAAKDSNSTFTVPNLSAGQPATLTVLVDNMGYDENGEAGGDEMKIPRGILSYKLGGHDESDITWKITGNLGGEDYADRTRGPLNEGGLYAERQGWHLPKPPSDSAPFKDGKPTDGITRSGVAFYTAQLDLDLPQGYDIPLSFVFTNATSSSNTSSSSSDSSSSSSSGGSNFRCQLYVNGYQFGKYVNNVGPQLAFPVPVGILNPSGSNSIALSLWAQDSAGAKVAGLKLEATGKIQSGYGEVAMSPMPAYSKRDAAY
ncbi:MAG: hypothetical protein M4579_001274 [Chaenotheca gracillima]|nr:MAG: hypothetical protein M4579_001274 [Chaenotheca gracillima]